MDLAMRHGVLFYEATGLIPTDLTFRHGVLFYDSTRIAYWSEKSLEDRLACAELNGLGEAEAARAEERVA
jgi:hypothetical protein